MRQLRMRQLHMRQLRMRHTKHAYIWATKTIHWQPLVRGTRSCRGTGICMSLTCDRCQLAGISDIWQCFGVSGRQQVMRQFVCLSVCMSVCLSVCLSVCPSVCLSVCLPACLSIRAFVCLSVCLSVGIYMSLTCDRCPLAGILST